MKHIKLFEDFTNESNIHFYSPGLDMEKLAATKRDYNYDSPKDLVNIVSTMFLPPNKLKELSDGRVSLKPESKSKFYIQTTTKFDMDKIKEELIDFAFSFMGAEGISGVSIKELSPKQLVVYADLQDGVTINGEKQKS